MKKFLELPASELGRLIEKRVVDPLEIVEEFIEVIEDHPVASQIYTIITKERAVTEAKSASKRAKNGARLSQLDGVPISWKDLFDTFGYSTEAGTALLKGRKPLKDARVLEVATSKGLICLGKTHMSELAFSGLGLNPITASPPCINFPDCVSGGSSSGSAASVAFNLAPSSIGSDTGGSVRIPAAWNDLVGLKTTSGLLSLDGVVPLCPSFDTVGPLTRTVEDASLLLTAMIPNQKPTDISNVSLNGARLGVLKTVALDELEDKPAAGFDYAIKTFEKAGANLSELDIECVGSASSLSGELFSPEAYGTWKEKIETNPDLMFKEILDRFRGGAALTAAEYVRAWTDLRNYRSLFLSEASGFDAIICPTSPIMPPELERLMSDRKYYIRKNLLALRNTRIGNLMGLCAITLPTNTPSCGIMLMMPPFKEKRLLRLSAAAEYALNI